MYLILSTLLRWSSKNQTPLQAGCVCNIWTDVKLPWLLPCYFHWKPVYICRGHAAIMQTHANEAMHDGGNQDWSPWCTCNFSVWTVDQAVTLRCFESTRLPQSVLLASEPSSDFRRNYVADSIMIFWIISPKPCRRCIWIISSKPCRRFIYLFWWRSWPWKPFRRTSIIRRVHR